jgi:hypothetical protein
MYSALLYKAVDFDVSIHACNLPNYIIRSGLSLVMILKILRSSYRQ